MTIAETKDRRISKTFDLVGQVFCPDEAAMRSFIEACVNREEFRDKSVLDAGCGTGIASIYFARNNARRVAGLDFSRDSILYGKRQATEGNVKNVQFIQGDVSTLPFGDESFDMVFSVGVLPYIKKIEPALRELARVTAPGGSILILSLRKTRWDFALEIIRRMLSCVPLRYAPLGSNILAVLCRPLSSLILRRKESKSGKTLQQTIVEAFFVPARLNKIEPEEIKDCLKNNDVDASEITPPTLSFCSPATVFIIKGIKNRMNKIEGLS